jgi:CRP/FNR family transcriptional regulator, anaerobic regulatory protein
MQGQDRLGGDRAQTLAQFVMSELNPRGKPVGSGLATRTLRRGQHLYWPGDTPDCVYSVHRGALKTYRVSHDYSEWIGGFHFSGEVLGLDALIDRPVRCGAVALNTVIVCLLPVQTLVECLGRSKTMRSQMLDRFADEITRLEEHLSLDALSAEQRLAAFILWVFEKLAEGRNGSTVSLPMSHKEIGNYLRLVPETVSRLLARFQDREWLSVSRRDLTVLNLEEVRRAAGGGNDDSSTAAAPSADRPAVFSQARGVGPVPI